MFLPLAEHLKPSNIWRVKQKRKEFFNRNDFAQTVRFCAFFHMILYALPEGTTFVPDFKDNFKCIKRIKQYNLITVRHVREKFLLRARLTAAVKFLWVSFSLDREPYLEISPKPAVFVCL